MKRLPDTAMFFLLAILYFLSHFPCPALSELNGEIPKHQFKIGTNEQERMYWVYIVSKDQRKNEEELSRFRKAASEIAIPPKELGVYEIKSEHLGTWAFFIDGLGYRDPDDSGNDNNDDDDDDNPSREDEFELKGKLMESFPNLISTFRYVHSFEHFAGAQPAGYKDGEPLREIPLSGRLNEQRAKRRWAGAPNKKDRLNRRSPSDDPQVIDLLDDSDDEMVDPELESVPFLTASKTNFYEMMMASQPPGVSLREMRGFEFEPSYPGAGVRVYVVDTGCDPSHEAFYLQKDELLNRDSTSWIYSGPFPDDEKNDNDLPNFVGNIPEELAGGNLWGYHGTSVASKIVGRGYGLAPFADLVVVKVQNGRNSVNPHLSILDTLIKIYDDVKRSIAQNDGGAILGAVINLSVSNNLSDLDDKERKWADSIIELYLDILRHFEDIEPKVYITILGGNDDIDTPTPLSEYPRNQIIKERVRDPGAFKQCLIVGGVDKNGAILYHGNNIDFYGPAKDLAVALPPIDPKRPHLLDGIQLTASGTSLSAPFVAGLLARTIGLNVKEIDPLEQMRQWAYPRKRNGPDVVWNGIPQEVWGQADGWEPENRKRPRPPDEDA
ncbi:hypothetical protein TWF594_007815 [Orbilia oligospora]|nr:hypothetical protein TWF103_001537 [Orbilia oligospora]KAF3136544.1 hypothetical protein TWF594_007815 [Orbilia oligospora]